MRIAFLIDEGSGPYTVTVGPAALCDWEAAHGRSVAELASSVGIADMTELVWRQRVREGYAGDLDAFRAALVDIDPAATGNPTSRASGL